MDLNELLSEIEENYKRKHKPLPWKVPNMYVEEEETPGKSPLPGKWKHDLRGNRVGHHRGERDGPR